MGVARGQVWQVDFGLPRGSAPGLIRPAVIISSDDFNDSAIRTVTVVALTTNMRRAAIPGNVLLAADICGLDRDFVINVTQIQTVDRAHLIELLAELPTWLLAQVDQGLRTALAIG